MRRKPKSKPFDPSKGQNKMGLREWADTHTGGNKRARWKRATTDETEGRAWQNRAEAKHGKKWNEVSQSDVAKQRAKNRKGARVKPKGYRPHEPEGGVKLGGGPDKPPPKNRPARPARDTNPNDVKASMSDYKSFLGGKKSTAALGAKFREAKGLAMTAAQKKKLAAAAAARRTNGK